MGEGEKERERFLAIKNIVCQHMLTNVGNGIYLGFLCATIDIGEARKRRENVKNMFTS